MHFLIWCEKQCWLCILEYTLNFWYAYLAKYPSFQEASLEIVSAIGLYDCCRLLPTDLFYSMKYFTEMAALNMGRAQVEMWCLAQPHHCKVAKCKTCYKHHCGPLQCILPFLISESGKARRAGCNNTGKKVCMEQLGRGGDVSVWLLFILCILILAARASMWVRISSQMALLREGRNQNHCNSLSSSFFMHIYLNGDDCAWHRWKCLVF